MSAWAGGFAWYGPILFASLNSTTHTQTPSSNCRNKVRPRDRRPAKEGIDSGFSNATRRKSNLRGWSEHFRQTYGRMVRWGVRGPFKPNVSALRADMTVTGSIAPSAPSSAPETRPTNRCGLDRSRYSRRDGSPRGPGVRMATRGDTVPGIARIDSIVRLGEPLDRCNGQWVDLDAGVSAWTSLPFFYSVSRLAFVASQLLLQLSLRLQLKLTPAQRCRRPGWRQR